MACLTHIFSLVLNQKQISKDVADIFNAPSDSEDFLGFQDDASRQRLLSEDTYANYDSLEPGKKVGRDCLGPVTLSVCSSTLSLCQGYVSYYSPQTP